MKRSISFLLLSIGLAACAGRAPQPVAISQAQDSTMGCPQVHSEITANNQKIQALASEKGGRVAQNVVAGVGGFIFPPLWFAMDFQGAATTEATALEQRNAYLGTLAQSKCQQAAAS